MADCFEVRCAVVGVFVRLVAARVCDSLRAARCRPLRARPSSWLSSKVARGAAAGCCRSSLIAVALSCCAESNSMNRFARSFASVVEPSSSWPTRRCARPATTGRSCLTARRRRRLRTAPSSCKSKSRITIFTKFGARGAWSGGASFSSLFVFFLFDAQRRNCHRRASQSAIGAARPRLRRASCACACRHNADSGDWFGDHTALFGRPLATATIVAQKSVVVRRLHRT